MKSFLLILLFSIITSKLEITEMIDNFDSYKEYSHATLNWKSSTFGFEIINNQLVHIKDEFCILQWKKSPYAYDTYFEIDIKVEKPYKTSEWEFVGAAIYKNENEYYAVQLVEHNTNGQRYPELKIVSDINEIGKSISVQGYDYIWKDGINYKLVIEIKEGNEGYTDDNYISIIKAHIYENEDTLVYEHIYGIKNKNALTFGKAAITSYYMKNCILRAYSTFSKIADYDNTNSFPEYNYNDYCSKNVKGFKLPQGKKTGYFHTEYFSDINKWWIIDPLGNPIFMKGINHVSYYGVYNDKYNYYPYYENVKQKYNNNETLWAIDQKNIMDKYGFNLASIGASKSMRHLGIPHSIQHNSEEFTKNYDYIIKPENNIGFPNVFNPNYEEYILYSLEKDSEEYINDPWVIGHFFDNELSWWGSDTFTSNNYQYGLFSAIFALSSDSSAKIELVNYIYDILVKYYESFEAGMTQVFGINNIKSKEDLLAYQNEIKAETDKAIEIAIDFTRIIAEKYYKIISSNIKAIDPNHMYLCDRFPGRIPFFSDIIEEYCDIITINYYPIFNPYSGINKNIINDLNNFHNQIKNKPLYITEWSVMALDVGLPSLTGAGLRVISQEQRAHSIQVLQLALASKDFIVGSDYFMYIDDSYDSRENCNYGLKNEKDDLYDLVSNYFQKVNEQTCARHINGEYKDLYDFKNVDWINENNLKNVDIETFEGSRNINFFIDINNFLVIKYKNIILGNIYLILHCNESFWDVINTYKIENIKENDYLYNLEISSNSYYSKINFNINIPKNFDTQEDNKEPWFLTKLSSIEFKDTLNEPLKLTTIYFLFNSSIGDDSKSNDIFGPYSSIPSYYRTNDFIYDKNIKIGLSLIPHGINLQYGKNNEQLNMEVGLNFENEIIIKPNEILYFDNFVKNQKNFYVIIDNININDAFSSFNETLYKFENEVIKYVEPKTFEYVIEDNYSNYIPNIKIIFYMMIILILL